ncbi:PREDICTED: agamous-like MADS-box protein AGL62 [Prunus mume]|uniref:Agamous-like MADS-box protein AGL62 n=1 Tax=Prunus mume TaxID=102107 RepID=A0ABM0PL54_PRUMU|nr:PREDICTED: agamous-like MADS-box protein AGL62 [Prunus mume]
MSDDSSSTVTKQRSTMGRKRIDIKKIQNTSSLQVTFSKRRTGLFRKASQLGALCGAEVAILVFSPHGRPFVFGHPSVDSAISRLAGTSTSAECMHASGDDEETHSSIVQSNLAHSGTTYETSPDKEGLCLRLRVGGGGSMGLVKEETQEVAEAWSGGRGFWWDQPTEKMKLHELKQFKTSLEDLRTKVGMQLDEMARRKLAARDFLGVYRNGSCG